eukprot:TRINITY_DN4810_c0_g1_i2.p1 TRINITY_DN4810_c0_g1~~TRINITY_DN4810_c0_g1_i2.p1  ORF type:complete len:212 (-),score=27.17 TRINITY_DN4810_c0_g1_i2:80-715(-)
MEQQMIESFRVISGLPQEALTELVQLAGNFLCSDFPMDKLKNAVDKTIEGIAGIEGVTISPKELEKHLETIIWFIESRYSKSYEVSQSELAKIGKKSSPTYRSGERVERRKGADEGVQTDAVEHACRVEWSIVAEKTHGLQLRVYQYVALVKVVNAGGSQQESSKLMVRMQLATVVKNQQRHNIEFEMTLGEFYEIYYELKKAKNLIDMMG